MNCQKVNNKTMKNYLGHKKCLNFCSAEWKFFVNVSFALGRLRTIASMYLYFLVRVYMVERRGLFEMRT